MSFFGLPPACTVHQILNMYTFATRQAEFAFPNRLIYPTVEQLSVVWLGDYGGLKFNPLGGHLFEES